MNASKLKILTSAILLFIIIIYCFSFLELSSENKGKDVSEQEAGNYAETHVYSHKVGETFTLDSEEDEEGADYNWLANFGWKGKMSVRLDEVTLYKRDQFDLLDKQYLISEDLDRQLDRFDQYIGTGDPSIICYQLTLKSDDAEPATDEGYSISNFNLSEDVDFASSEPIYLQGCYYGTKKFTGKNGYGFDLPKGKAVTLKIGFLVDKEVSNTPLALNIGISNIEKYVVEITPSDMKEAH